MKTYRNLAALVAFMCCLCSVWADVPYEYYASVNGKKKAELKSAFRNVIKTATVLDYGGGPGKPGPAFTLQTVTMVIRYATAIATRYFIFLQAPRQKVPMLLMV